MITPGLRRLIEPPRQFCPIFTIVLALWIAASPTVTRPTPLFLTRGLFELVYSALTWRDTVRDDLSALIPLENRTWHMLLPVACYPFGIGSGGLLLWRTPAACVVLALAMGMLLGIGIHNAWDITVWTITRRG